MIEFLNGIRETVSFPDNTVVRLYHNTVCEDYPDHWHVPLEIIMPLSGGFRVECDELSFDLRQGDILVINSGVIHRLFAPPVGERLIMLVNISSLLTANKIHTSLSLCSPAILITHERSPDTYQYLYLAMLQIEKEYMGNEKLKEAAIYSLVMQMLVTIGRTTTALSNRVEVKLTKQKEYIEKFLYICDYITEHCTEGLSLDRIAEIAGFSKYHFTRLFKQFTNVSFYKYLNRQRIANAEKMLIDPGVSILEASMRSGFSSTSAFIRMFKLHNNCTPSEYRYMNSNNQC